MKKIAIVVQRCHPNLAAGAEALAWQYALLLRATYHVEVLTTTALDYSTWANELRPGHEERDGLLVHRFPVTVGRSPYWYHLCRRLCEDYTLFCQQDGKLLGPRSGSWSLGLQEEFIRHQGPYSEPLLQFLENARAHDYHAVLFVTYLYATAYFGIARCPSPRVLLVPTLHDEAVAHLQAFRDMAQRVRSVVWLTESERRLGTRLWGFLPGTVAAMPVCTQPYPAAREEDPYLLYCGRIDAGKGCDRLLHSFVAFKERHESSPLRLILTGEDHLGIPTHPDLEFRGFVSPAEKYGLMAGAELFVMPSPLESFSLATLEAMGQGTPVLVNGRCEVLADHVRQSGAGRAYVNTREFLAHSEELLPNLKQRRELGARGWRDVLENYDADQVRDRLVHSIEDAVAVAA